MFMFLTYNVDARGDSFMSWNSPSTACGYWSLKTDFKWVRAVNSKQIYKQYFIIIIRTCGWQRSVAPILFASCGLIRPLGPILGGSRMWKRRWSAAASSSLDVQVVFSRGAPDLDPDPDLARYPVFFQDPVGSGSGRILKYENPAKSGSGRILTVWIRSTGFITM